MPRYFFRKSTDVQGRLPINNGGTGQKTAQTAINALTEAANATNGHVYTRNAAGNGQLRAKAVSTSHNADTDWGDPTGGYYTITLDTTTEEEVFLSNPYAMLQWNKPGFVLFPPPDNDLANATDRRHLANTYPFGASQLSVVMPTPLRVQAWELVATDYVTTAKVNRILLAANGNIQLRVTSAPDNRYAGRIVVM
jgi:hypothetical protein